MALAGLVKRAPIMFALAALEPTEGWPDSGTSQSAAQWYRAALHGRTEV